MHPSHGIRYVTGTASSILVLDAWLDKRAGDSESSSSSKRMLGVALIRIVILLHKHIRRLCTEHIDEFG